MCLEGNCREPFPSKNLKQSHFGYCYVPVTLYFFIIFFFYKISLSKPQPKLVLSLINFFHSKTDQIN